MSIAFLAPSAPIQEPSLVAALPRLAAEAPAAPAGFGALVSDGLRQVDARLHASELDLQRLAAGHVENLHHIMMGLEETRLSLQLLMQVRNRLLESYQDLMRMQV